jgi:hypothetical protein
MCKAKTWIQRWEWHCNGVSLGMYDLRSKGEAFYAFESLNDFNCNSTDWSIDYRVV